MLAGLVPSKAHRGNLFYVSLLASGGLLEIIGILWHVGTLTQCLPSCLHGSLYLFTSSFLHARIFGLCVQISSLYKDNSHIDLGTHFAPV